MKRQNKIHLIGNAHLDPVFLWTLPDGLSEIKARLFMCDELKMVKLTFAPAFKIRSAIYGTAAEIIGKPVDGREQPMQRFIAVTDGDSGLAVCAKGKYSASANENYFAFAAVRTCYFADHIVERDGRLTAQDLGINEFEYTVSPFTGDAAQTERTSEILHAEFPLINETYHKGCLKQSCSLSEIRDSNIILTALKPAEDGGGLIFRLRETAGKQTDSALTWNGCEYPFSLEPHGIASYRLSSRGFIRTNFLED